MEDALPDRAGAFLLRFWGSRRHATARGRFTPRAGPGDDLERGFDGSFVQRAEVSSFSASFAPPSPPATIHYQYPNFEPEVRHIASTRRLIAQCRAKSRIDAAGGRIAQ